MNATPESKDERKGEPTDALEQVQYLKKVLLAVRNVNQLIVREHDAQRLIEQSCELLTETLGYHNAWILVRSAQGLPARLACAGLELGVLESALGMDLAGRPEAASFRLPCLRQVEETGRIYVTDNPAKDCGGCPLAEAYEGRAGLAAPLCHDGRMYGFLVVSVPDAHARDQEALDLFGELAGDLAFALRRIEMQAELEESEQRSSIVFDSIGDAVMTTDASGRVERMNLRAQELTGWPQSEACGRPLTEVFRIVNAFTRQPAKDPVARVLATGEIVGLANHTVLIARDGTERQIADSCAPVRSSARKTLGTVLVFRDVTEDYRQRERIRESEERFQKMLSLVPDLVSIHDPDMNILYSNWNAFGAVSEEKRVLNTKCYKTYRGLDNICPDCRAIRVMRTKQAFQEEVELPDGTWIDLRVIPVLKDNGDVKCFVEWVRDITEEKKQNEALVESEKLNRTVMDNLPIGIAVNSVDPSVEFSYMNDRFPEIYRTTREALSKPGAFWDIVYEDPVFRKSIKSRVEKDCASGDVSRMHWDNVSFTRNGEGPYCINASNIPLQGLRAMISTVLDVTERKRAEDALQEKTRWLQRITDNMFDLVAVADLDGRFTYASPSHRLLGYEPEELLGKHVLDWVHPDDLPLVSAALGEALNLKNDDRRVEYRYRSADGSYRWFETAGRFIRDENGRTRELLLNTRDITERKNIEAALREAKAAADEALAVKSRFLASMSHELRTPLNGVIAPAEILLEMLSSGEKRELAKMIADSGRHLLELVNDILDFARIEAGKLRIRRAPCAIRDLVAETLAPLALRAKEKGLAFDVSVADSVPDHCRADRLRVGQVLLNLAGNAVKFTQTGGVSVGVALAERRSGISVVKFTVADTGIGFRSAEIHEMFAPFVQEDSERIRALGGAGLGLSISRYLVELMGGDIGAESEPGQGARFWFSLPLEDVAEGDVTSKAVEKQADREADTALTSARALVVEDNKVNLAVATMALRALGVREVAAAENGAQALDLLAARQFDLVLMDCQMPVMDGYEATRRIRQMTKDECGTRNAETSADPAFVHRSSFRIPIVALTAHAMPDDREKCLAAGMDDYLAKPIEPQALSAMLRKWLPERNDESGMMKDEAGNSKQETGAIKAERKGRAPAMEGGRPLPPDVKPATEARRPPGLLVWNRSEALERFMGEESAVREIAVVFLEDAPRQIEALQACFEKGDAESALRQAHSLKGAAANIGGEAMREAAWTIESRIRAGSLAEAASLMPQLKSAFEALAAEMRREVVTS